MSGHGTPSAANNPPSTTDISPHSSNWNGPTVFTLFFSLAALIISVLAYRLQSQTEVRGAERAKIGFASRVQFEDEIPVTAKNLGNYIKSAEKKSVNGGARIGQVTNYNMAPLDLVVIGTVATSEGDVPVRGLVKIPPCVRASIIDDTNLDLATSTEGDFTKSRFTYGPLIFRDHLSRVWSSNYTDLPSEVGWSVSDPTGRTTPKRYTATRPSNAESGPWGWSRIEGSFADAISGTRPTEIASIKIYVTQTEQLSNCVTSDY